MIPRLKSFFTPPVFEDNDKTRVARHLYFLLAVIFAVAAAATVFFSITTPASMPRVATTVIPIPLIFLVAAIMAKRGWVYPGAFFIVLVAWTAVTVNSLVSGGMRSPGFGTGSVLALILAGLLLGRRGAFLVIFLNVAMAILFAWGSSKPWMPPVPDTVSTSSILASYLINMLLSGSMLYLTIDSIQKSLDSARLELRERMALEKEREKLLSDLDVKNKELQERNLELESFNYTVSHELKSPVVTIKGFIGSISTDLKNKKYERAEKDLLRISAAADKMQDTLTDLHKLSTLGRLVKLPVEISMVRLVQDVLQEMRGQTNFQNISVIVFPGLPVVYGDWVRLQEVYKNLIDNASKHMGDQISPKIEIGARKDAGNVVLYVKDNGVGIDPIYHNRVFGLFNKLDAGNKGTGVGLTLVKRIIEAHGGRIWVESEGLGKGSTFCFTLPAKSPVEIDLPSTPDAKTSTNC
jgi:signal transduction histidine kinase